MTIPSGAGAVLALLALVISVLGVIGLVPFTPVVVFSLVAACAASRLC